MSSDSTTRLVASMVAAGVAEAGTLPTDVAKVRLQVQGPVPQYSGMVDCIRQIAKNEGYGSLWKGLHPALIRQCCYSSMSLVLYEPIRDVVVGKDNANPSFPQRLLAGGVSGAISIAVFNWTEVIKTQMQTSERAITMKQVIGRVHQAQGVRGFWAGVQPNIARTFLVNAAELGTYDQAKSMLIPVVGDNPLAHLGASGIAGLASACVSTPADVVKTRLMNSSGNSAGAQYNGILDTVKSVHAKEGAAAFYKGFVPICVRKVLWCSVFFMSYEHLKKVAQSTM